VGEGVTGTRSVNATSGPSGSRYVRVGISATTRSYWSSTRAPSTHDHDDPAGVHGNVTRYSPGLDSTGHDDGSSAGNITNPGNGTTRSGCATTSTRNPAPGTWPDPSRGDTTTVLLGTLAP
jgi:hypothetical protein